MSTSACLMQQVIELPSAVSIANRRSRPAKRRGARNVLRGLGNRSPQHVERSSVKELGSQQTNANGVVLSAYVTLGRKRTMNRAALERRTAVQSSIEP